MSIPSWAVSIHRPSILRACEEYGLDPSVVSAMVYHESSNVEWKTRAEVRPSQEKYLVSYREMAKILSISESTEYYAQLHSWGLLQVMGYVARELGHRGYLTELIDPIIGLTYGCRKLKKLYEKYGNDFDVISAYNQGGPYKNESGMYKNQKLYVDPIFRLIEEYRRKREAGDASITNIKS